MKEESYCVCILYIQICDNFCQWKTKMVHSALTFQASSIHYVYADWGLIGHIWGLWCLKQISQAWINNCIPQNTVRCNYLPLPEVPASGTQVLNIRHWTGLSLLTTLLHLLFWNQKASLDNQMVWDCESHPAHWEVRVLSACYVGIRKYKFEVVRMLLRLLFNTLKPRQNGRHFPDDIFKCIFLNENVWILIKISLNFVPRVKLTMFQHCFR